MKDLRVYKTNTSYFFNDHDEADVYIVADEIGMIKAAVNMGGVWFELKDAGFIEELEHQIEKQGFDYMDLVLEHFFYSVKNCIYQYLIENKDKLPKITN